MIALTLKRIRYTDEGTFGTLRIERNGKELVLFTAELPPRGNRPRVSCVPPGNYPVKLERSAKFGKDLWELQDVPGREEIKIHNGNFAGDKQKGWESEVEGCILVGTRHDALMNKKPVYQRGVAKSKEALRQLMEFTNGETEGVLVVIGDVEKEKGV